VPVEFIACIEPGHDLDEAHHRQLLNNCFAQGAALMAGRANADGARAYAGDRPSTTLLLDQLDPEGRTFLQKTPLFVPHARIAENARVAGLSKILLTAAADAGILAGLVAYNWTA
jgi:hypothetical protein